MGQSVRDGLEKAATIVDAAAERYQKIADVNRQEHGYSGIVAVLKETAKSIREAKTATSERISKGRRGSKNG